MNCSVHLSQSFLRSELSPEEQSQFEEHLEHCESCRQFLDAEICNQADGLELQSRLLRSKEISSWSPFDDVRIAQDRSRTFAADLAMLAPSDDPESLGRIGLFEARAILGRGGMGTVYKAIDPALGRTVAIKVLRPDLASIGSARERFALEARAMASIAHPHVVPIHAVDEHGGLPYMAMEYVPGGNLESRLRKDGPFELLSVLRIAQQIASALDAAHECGLVHRDIKPANILLDRGVDRVRVADFGLVRVSDDASMTRSGIIAGTPQFMSPEQVKGETCDARSDLFSLGAVMYSLLAGHAPFRAETPYAAMLRIVHDTPRPLQEWRHDIPDWLARFVDRLLEKSPEQRFVHAREVAECLEEELVHLQSPASSPPKREWLQRPAAVVSPKTRRNRPFARVSAIGIAAAVCALIAGLGVAVYQPWAPSTSDSNRIRSPWGLDGTRQPPSGIGSQLLWSNDGFSELKQQLDALGMQSNASPSEAPEPWWSEVQALHHRLDRMETLEP